MNLKTTFTLVVLLVVGGVSWLTYNRLRPADLPAQAVAVLGSDATPDKIQKIEIARGEPRVVLERSGSEWTLPGKWPVRTPEANELVNILTKLHSRFVPISLGEPPDLKKYGLATDQRPLTVKVTVDAKPHELVFGEKQDENNRFSRETYVRVDGAGEVIRLAPGMIALLDRPQEYYMQRRLFPTERVLSEAAGPGERAEKVERLAAQAVAVESPAGKYALARTGDDWELHEPWQDRADPDKVKSILTNLPDLWAEKFVGTGKDLKEYGLDKPEQTLRVTRTGGDVVTLLIGKESDIRRRIIPPPPAQFGQPPMQPRIIEEVYHFAKLRDNDQIFEIKVDKLKDVSVSADAVRDARLDRFRTEDVRRLEIHDGDKTLIFVKDKASSVWKIEGPTTIDAEPTRVTELLDKLSGLQARDKDILDKADLKQVGLADKPATVKLTVEETKGTGEAKATKTRELTFAVGKEDTEKKKVYVQVAGRPRVNAVESDLLKLVKQPALAYRNRKVLDFSPTDLTRIGVKRGTESFTLEQAKGAWRLATPVQADIDTGKSSQLAADLSRLEAVEFVEETPKAEDLDKTYGLDKPTLTVELKFSDDKKPAQTLLIGKAKAGKPEFFAKLASAPAVFTIKKETQEVLDKDSLAYRPLDLWQLRPQDIAELRVLKEEPEYALKRDGAAWKISGPFDASADAAQVGPMTLELAKLHGERYVVHAAKDLAQYGLDKPYLRVAIKSAENKAPADAPKPDEKEEKKERVLLIGKPTEKDAKTRFAKLGDSEAVFVVGEKTLTAADHSALDLLDRKLLGLDGQTIRSVRGTSGPSKYTLQKEKGAWRVTDSPAPAFNADPQLVGETLRSFADLRAMRFAAYGDKVNVAEYGLDKPAATVTVVVQPPGEGAKPVEHTLLLGKPVAADKGERFARLDKSPGVVVLDANTVNDLNRTHLDFVDRTILKLDADKVIGLTRKAGAEVLEVVKAENVWKLVKPTEHPADAPTLQQLVDQLGELRAVRVAAYPAVDVKPFGLDVPAAVVTIRVMAKDKPTDSVLEIGKVDDEKGKERGDRFARLAGSNTVVVLPGALVKQLTAAPLAFRDRTIAKIGVPDKVTVERGGRKAVFVKAGAGWKMSEPLDTEAEQMELEDWLKAVSNLRANELVVEKAADVKPYGLDRPQARWRFTIGDKDALVLLVGATDKDKSGRAYARVEGSDVVFLLDSLLSVRALAEYRSRTVWSPAPPDAAQVERITFGRTAGSFRLEKVDGKWQVAGMPAVTVKPEAVTDALDALAGLRAERYVADKGTDLKLYGLEPQSPDLLIVEVQTPSGKRALHIGRQEDGSSRRYAAVPGDGAPVFLISEADAKRLVRQLADLQKTTP